VNGSSLREKQRSGLLHACMPDGGVRRVAAQRGERGGEVRHLIAQRLVARGTARRPASIRTRLEISTHKLRTLTVAHVHRCARSPLCMSAARRMHPPECSTSRGRRQSGTGKNLNKPDVPEIAMKKFLFSLRAAAAVAALFATVQGAQALDQLVPPSQPVAGMTQLDLSQQWWKWALAIPAPGNPILDTTGAYANVNNYGPVFFVAGSVLTTVERSFKVPAGRPIFFPVINAADVEVPGTCDLACAFGWLTWVNSAAYLHAHLDGVSLLQEPYDAGNASRQTSSAFFTVRVPDNNVFGMGPPYVGKLDAVSDGFWVAIDGLSAGDHTLTFGGTFMEFSPDPGMMTIHITAVSKEMCRQNGWSQLGFKNQGQCVQFANTGR
jgi:hypothetical protein